MSKFLVTGGAGFIGSGIAEKLLKLGHSVRVIDNLSTGDLKNLKPILKDIEFIYGDLADYTAAKKAVDGMDYVLHQAAIPSVAMSILNPSATNASIVTATVNLFEAAVREGNIKRIVQASSSAVYGDTEALIQYETSEVLPKSPYALAKWVQERYASLFYNLYGLEVISLRYFNVFGEKQSLKTDYSGVIPIFIKEMINTRSPKIYGDGSNSRDFVYVNDVVEANILAANCKWTGRPEAINIGTGTATSINELVAGINQVLGKNIKPEYCPCRQGDIRYSVASINKAAELLNYKVNSNFICGLNKVIMHHLREV